MGDDGDDDFRYAEGEENGGALLEEGPNGRGAFDPTPYMRQLRGRGGAQDYLDVKWRLLWLRREHPDAEIVTEHVQIDPTIAIFKATVSLPTGGKATGYGSETAGDFGDFIEKAETKAIGRALNALGYGAQFGERGAEEDDAGSYPRPVDAPAAPSTPEPSPSATARPPVAAAPSPVPDAGSSGRPGGGREQTEREATETVQPIDFVAGRERVTAPRPSDRAAGADTPPVRDRKPVATTAGEPGTETTAASEPDLAEYSWTAFWPWARGLGLNGPKAVEGLIGRPTAGLTPAELRDLIRAARNED